MTGDIDGNGTDDIVADFGVVHGVWSWMNNTSWVQIHSNTSEQIAIRYLDDNEQVDVIIDFGSSDGLWVWKNNNTWEQLHTVSPSLMVH